MQSMHPLTLKQPAPMTNVVAGTLALSFISPIYLHISAVV